ncbi:MAG: BREX-1 system adenine-specific DNA-methyltransferase PglX, partial [Clostridiales bacterium]|nr:BREX-1 system adenine-specific DNA-methyltransferase PglX [Clostridiales bacterium]
YVEEGIYTKEEIPYKILENNIYGIDIDLRAVQLTGLILFIKTKSILKDNGYDTNTKDKLSVNLVCADSILLNGSRLEDLKEKHKNNKTILKMIEIIYEEFEDVRLKGSLIQPEKKLFPLFEEFKNRIAKKELSKAKRTKRKQTKGQETLLNEQSISLSDYKSQRDFTKEERELMSSLDTLYSEAIKANDISRQLFANEAKKSVKLVNIFMQKKGYDVVTTNPPYLWNRNMTPKLKKFIVDNYKDWSTDLYSVFIARCLDFLNQKGKLGMITQQSFMFISSYAKVREELLNNYYIEKMVHLGPRAFDDISGEKVNTVMFIIEKSNPGSSKSYFLRLYDKQSSEDKKEYLIDKDKREKYEFFVDQNKFKNISGMPFVYWLDDHIFEIFKHNKSIASKYKVLSGMRIGANDKFLRFHWEIDSIKLGNEWKIYNKGGEFSRFYGEYKYVIDWRKEALNYYDDNNSHRNQSMYFKRGVTYTLISSSGFSVRIIPEGSVFDAAGPSIFCDKDNMFYLCGYLNSSLVSYLLNVLNSTINYTPTDTNKLPYIEPSIEILDQLKEIGKIGYLLARERYKYVETSLGYTDNLLKEILKKSENQSLFDSVKTTLDVYNALKFIENKLIMLIDELVFEVYGIDDSLQKKIVRNINSEIYENIEEYDKYSLKDLIDTSKEVFMEDCILLCQKNIFIQTLKKLFRIKNSDIINEIKGFISYYVGLVIRKWNNEKGFTGILPVSSSIYLEEDLIERIYDSIYEDYGDLKGDMIIEEIDKILNKSLENYIIDDFFKEHLKKYEKRPIYWHICSPKKTFNCFVYYHKLDNDTLYKVKSIYLSQMINRYEEDLKYYTSQLIEARTNGDKSKEKDFKDKCSDLEAKLEDLNILDKKIMEILPYKPNIDEGVLYNIIPIEPILSAPVATKRER